MSAFFELLRTYGGFWPYAAASLAGVFFAGIDRNVIGRPVLAALLVIAGIGGAVGLNVSHFTFSGDDYYFQSFIIMLFALAGLAGYALAYLAMWTRARTSRGGAS
jgi:hypothetical protein